MYRQQIHTGDSRLHGCSINIVSFDLFCQQRVNACEISGDGGQSSVKRFPSIICINRRRITNNNTFTDDSCDCSGLTVDLVNAYTASKRVIIKNTKLSNRARNRMFYIKPDTVFYNQLSGFVMVKAPGKVLNQKFVSLGTLKGKTYDEIVAVCGVPSSNSAIDGGTVKQWMATGYHIALLFDENNVCLGVSHETSV